MATQGLHVGFIMDGNRRFAKKLLLQPWKGHESGTETLDKVLSWCQDKGIAEVTLYAFSIQNFNRPKHEFNYLMDLFRKTFQDNKKIGKIMANDIKVNFHGRLELFPEDIQAAFKNLEEKTKDHQGYQLNFCFGYGGREELVDATYAIAKKIQSGELLPEQIDEELINKHVYIPTEPDFIVRTGGDHRTSNFLVWQSAYSEWFFLDKVWPELTAEDLDAVLEEFNQRERRFGK